MSDSTLKISICKKLKEFDLNLEFETKKGVLGILGSSGSGKSMTLKAISGLIDIDDGIIELNNKKLTDIKNNINLKPQKRKIGYLFQNYALFPNMTVKNNILMVMNKNDKDRVNDVISMFRLDNLEDRYPHQLSGGQQQRVALARIFAYEPEVILLDEPFSAMDSFLKDSLKEQLSNTLKQYDGITILVTHDRDEAFQLCDNLIIMDNGKIIRRGKTKDVFNNPKSLEAAKLLGCKNISRIRKIDKNHVEAIAFNNIILTVDAIDDDVKYVGIRAHDFKIQDVRSDGVNIIDCNIDDINSTPFEWNVKLRNGIIWKKSKDNIKCISDIEKIKYLKIDKDKILFLN